MGVQLAENKACMQMLETENLDYKNTIELIRQNE